MIFTFNTRKISQFFRIMETLTKLKLSAPAFFVVIMTLCVGGLNYVTVCLFARLKHHWSKKLKQTVFDEKLYRALKLHSNARKLEKTIKVLHLDVCCVINKNSLENLKSSFKKIFIKQTRLAAAFFFSRVKILVRQSA